MKKHQRVFWFFLLVLIFFLVAAMRYDNWRVNGSDSSLDAYVNGTKSVQVRTDHWIPPVCPADLNDVTFGGICSDVGTGKIRYRGILEAIP